jgi:hypothetical protein
MDKLMSQFTTKEWNALLFLRWRIVNGHCNERPQPRLDVSLGTTAPSTLPLDAVR